MYTSIVSPKRRTLHVKIPSDYKPESEPFGDIMVELNGDTYTFRDVLRWIDDMPYIRIPPEAGWRNEKVKPDPKWETWIKLPCEEITPDMPE